MLFKLVPNSTRAQLVLWLIIISLYRILSLLQPQISLFFDEAYYVHWSEALDFGYYSKPPMVAWCIALFTHILGTSEFTVKLAAPTLYFLSTLVVYEIAICCVTQRAALYAAIIFSCTPIVGFNSLFFTTDSPLILCWALSTLLAIKCLTHNKPMYWLLLGITLGAGMLSKYSFAALALGLLLFIAVNKRVDIIRNPLFWLTIVIGTAIASPNLYWNWQHGFASYAHTHDIAQLSDAAIKPIALIHFLISQVFIFGLVWVAVIIGKRSTLKAGFQQPQLLSLLLCTMLPLLVLISLQALLSRAFANWSAPFIIPASIFAGVAVSQCRRRAFIIGCTFNLLLLGLIYHWPQIQSLARVEASERNSPYFRLMGWEQLGQSAKPILTQYPEASLLSDSRELLAYIGFYSDTPAAQLYFWNPDRNRIENHYDLVHNVDTTVRSQQTFLFITKTPLAASALDRFENTQFVAKHSLTINSNLTREIYIYRVKTFRGYRDE